MCRPAHSVLLLGVLAVAAVGCGEEEAAAPPPPRAPAAADDADTLAQLQLLGYVNSVPVDARGAAQQGVTLHDPARAWDGLNLFNARHERVARLMTLSGEVVHTWRSDETGAAVRGFRARLPDRMPGWLDGWNHVELLPDGGLLAIGTHDVLLRLDRDSRLVWKREIAAHHDVDVTADGEIVVLVDELRVEEVDGAPVAYQDAVLVVLAPDGTETSRLSLRDALAGDARVALSLRRVARNRPLRLAALAREAEGGAPGAREALRLYAAASAGDVAGDAAVKNVLFHNEAEDVFHANSVEVLARAEPGRWEAGDLLVSVLRFDTDVVVSRRTGRVVWSWGSGTLDKPHDASQLADGDLLVFDNGPARGWSRVVRMRPATGAIVWEYRADPPTDFFSGARGGAQQLPNGNVLVTSTDDGEAFEVTPDGERVWQFWTEPTGAGERAAVYRMRRFARADLPWLGAGSASP